MDKGMAQRMRERLDQLRVDYARGQLRLTALDKEKAELEHMLQRITGAIQILEEELARPED